jgi:hypothetical protein
MNRIRVLPVVGSFALLLAACGSGTSTSATTTQAVVTTTVPATTVPATTVPPTTVPATVPPTSTVPAATTTVPAAEVQPAIWPAADVVFTTPEAAALDFVTKVLGEGPVLGPFQAGDSRSGEIEVFASVDGAPIGTARSVLMLRQLGPADGWFVIAAASDFATITTPVSMSTIPPIATTVAGKARGFEANVNVRAFVAGAAQPVLDQQITMAGNLETALPYSVTLDLSGASPGDVVVLLVHGGAGLETDPGDFGAIPVVIAGWTGP